jgi:predicted CopG family antitoxin
MSIKIKISDENYRRLIEAKEEMGYDSIDKVIEDLLDFWGSFVNRGTKG